MVSASVENVQNQFEQPNQEDVCICLSLKISIQHSLSGLDFSVSDLRRAPSVNFEFSKFCFTLFRLGPTLGASVEWVLLGPAQ